MRLHPYLEFGGPIAFAHRGGAFEQPENSMRAFEAAIDLGYTYLETDARVTSDGVLVAFHDETLDRVTDLRGAVAERSYDEIASARVSGTEPIPRLEEVLATWPEARFNIDIKCDGAVEPLSKLIRDLHCIDRICLASRSAERLFAMRQTWGEKLCAALAPGEIARLGLATCGLPTGQILGRCAQVPDRQVIAGLAPWRLDARFLRAAHGLNIPVHVWTINERETMEHLIELGVDGIMTDRPSLLGQVLDQRGLWWHGKRQTEAPAPVF